jgi:hypothetical protein
MRQGVMHVPYRLFVPSHDSDAYVLRNEQTQVVGVLSHILKQGSVVSIEPDCTKSLHGVKQEQESQ